MKRFLFVIGLMALLSIVACNNESQWSVEGTMEGAGDGVVVLEAFNAIGNNWYVIDSMAINEKGEFKSTQPAPNYPDIYRLNYNKRYIYLPVDSVVKLTVNTKVSSFDSDFTLEGSNSAKVIENAEHLINSFVAANGAASIDTAQNLKRKLGDIIFDDLSSVASYYIVHRDVNGHRIFNPTNKVDLRMIGAVANAFLEKRPNDPRTKYLEQYYISARRMHSTTQHRDTLLADEIKILDVDLPNSKGEIVRLRDVAQKNKVVLLNFTSYDADFSTALNIALHKTYNANKDKGLQIYQVGVSNDEYQWRMAAANQPWITVFNSLNKVGDTYLLSYNVTALPVIFIIRNGEIVERLNKLDNLQQSLARYL